MAYEITLSIVSFQPHSSVLRLRAEHAARGHVLVHTPAPDFLLRLQHHPAEFILTAWWVWLPWLRRKTLNDLVRLKMAPSWTRPTPKTDSTGASLPQAMLLTAHKSLTHVRAYQTVPKMKSMSVWKKKTWQKANVCEWNVILIYSTRVRSRQNGSKEGLQVHWQLVGVSLSETGGCVHGQVGVSEWGK